MRSEAEFPTKISIQTNTILCAASITICIALFIYFATKAGVITALSQNNNDWAAFGSYFGGTVGPLLSFFGIVLIAVTLSVQLRQISENRQFMSDQIYQLEEQIALIRQEQTISRLETVAAAAESEINHRISNPLPAFGDINLGMFIRNLQTRAGLRHFAKKTTTLLELIEGERLGSNVMSDGDSQSAETTSLASRVLSVDTLPRLGWALEDYRKALDRIIDADNLTSPEEKSSYRYRQLEKFSDLVTSLYMLGVLDDAAPVHWQFSGSLLITDGPYVARRKVLL